MITIIEGADCSGKTTLQSALFPGKHGWTHDHFGPPSRGGAWRDYTDYLTKVYATRLSMKPVVDRYVYGELIYPALMHRESRFTPAHARMLERVMLAMEGLAIFCRVRMTTAMDTYREMVATRHEMISKEEQFIESWIAWDSFIQRANINLPFLVYNYETMTLESLAHQIALKRPPENRGPGIGMFREGVTLMIGEKVNNKQAIHGEWPFVAEKASSLWLTEQLSDCHVNERELYWINAIDYEGAATDARFVDRLKPTRIVALGNEAAQWCKHHGFGYATVPHPAFWMRFHAGEPYLPLMRALGL